MQSYYVLSNGRVRRTDNTVYIENAEGKKTPVPIEDVDSLYLFGEVDLNTKLLNFLSTKRIPLHVFNYYGFYAGSYYPREYLHSGYLLVHQVRHYADKMQRLTLARELVRAAAHSLLRNLAYYERRKGTGAGVGGGRETADDADPPGEIGGEISDAPALPGGIPTDADLEIALDASLGMALPGPGMPELPESSELSEPLETLPDPLAVTASFGAVDAGASLLWTRTVIEGLVSLIPAQGDVSALMGIEGKIRQQYYAAWRHIVRGDWAFERRVRRPPDNEINALISLGNSVLYTVCLSEIYRTQLTPTISYLHEPGARRFSLALDLSEIFKPLIVDRAIFRLLNTGQLKESHFDRSLGSCCLSDSGKRLFVAALEERLRSTLKHRRLNRHVSYRHLIRLECHKLVRHLTDVEPYHAFRAWW